MKRYCPVIVPIAGEAEMIISNTRVGNESRGQEALKYSLDFEFLSNYVKHQTIDYVDHIIVA